MHQINNILIISMFRYIGLGKLLQQCLQRGKQLKTVIYGSGLPQRQIAPAYSLLSLVLNNKQAVADAQQEIVSKSGITIKNKYLLMVMIAQFINKGKIVGGGKLKNVVLQHSHLIPKIDTSTKINKSIVQVRLRPTHQKYRQILSVISQKSTVDKVVPNMFHLTQESYSQLAKNASIDLLKSPAVVIQSFSSALPPTLLTKGVFPKWSGRKFDCIDACSAPGNKTIQLAQYVQNRRVFAFQKNEKRFDLLNSNINKYNVSNISTRCCDFLTIKPGPKFKKVKFILLDPSCSGSGMLTNFTRDSNISQNHQQKQAQTFQEFVKRRWRQLDQKDKKRVQNLHQFQVSLLKHAASFRPVRISYSTCSIYPRQDEDVVAEFMAAHPQYKIKKYNKMDGVLKGFGSDFQNCIRVDPREMRSDGFFVCVFSLKK